VRAAGAALGVDIAGTDLSLALAAETVDAIKRAWSDHSCCGFAASGSTTTS
jgi:hypothetical protein